MNPTKILQSSPERANELFAKLAETTPGAVKTRERLFGELKSEIERLAGLEHDHVLPALRKREGTKTIVAQTGERLRAIGILLRRLENTPKQEEAFLAGVAELKAIFQQHLRDEKGALLPKVQKALGDEEIQKVAERVEADRAGAEATARREADVQRARARLERETEQARQAAAEAAQREARRLEREKRANERAARAAAEAAEATEAAEREARERLEQSARTAAVPVVTATAMGTAGASEAMEMLQSTAETARSHATAVPADLAFAQAAQDASREWMSWAQTRAQNQVAGLTALLQCRTLHDVIGLQGRLVREDMELFMATGARISGIAAASSPAAAGSVDPNS